MSVLTMLVVIRHYTVVIPQIWNASRGAGLLSSTVLKIIIVARVTSRANDKRYQKTSLETRSFSVFSLFAETRETNVVALLPLHYGLGPLV